jgi:hypothetical protein
MSLINFSEQSRGNPLEVVERMATTNDWSFERAGEDEITILVRGKWTDYQVSYTWITTIEALHVACAFEFKVPDHRHVKVLQLLAMINEQLWIGHFDLTTSLGVPGGFMSPPHAAAVDRVLAAAAAAGKPVGSLANDLEDARALLERGFRLIVLGDLAVFQGALREGLAELRG